jgi:hypothetical protein
MYVKDRVVKIWKIATLLSMSHNYLVLVVILESEILIYW